MNCFLAVKALGPALLACALTLTLHDPAHAQAAPKILKKVPPEFPDDAGGATGGTVKARLSIDPQGLVTDVTVLESSPKRVFDKAAVAALKAWRFESGGAPQTYEVKIVFSNSD